MKNILSFLSKYKKFAPILIIVIFVASVFVWNTYFKSSTNNNQEKSLQAALAANPNDPTLLDQAGSFYYQKKNYPKAISYFESAIAKDPKLLDAYHNLGEAYRVTGQADKALEIYKKDLAIDPRDWTAMQLTANVYYDKKDMPKTAEFIEAALAINPVAQLYSNLGIIYLQIGERDKAKTAFEKALKIDPTLQIAKDGLTEAGKDPGANLPPEVLKALEDQKKAQEASASATAKP